MAASLPETRVIYRRLLRAVGIAFQGDQEMLVGARKWARVQVARDHESDGARETHVTQLCTFLRRNVAQCRRVPSDPDGPPRYRLILRSEHEINEGHVPLSTLQHSRRCC